MCAAVLIGLSITPGAFAQSDVHPEIGSTVPRDLKASDILALPLIERQAWIHGAVSLLAQSTSRYSPDTTGCILGWYFESNGAEVIDQAFRAYPNAYATSLVFAAAENVCKP